MARTKKVHHHAVAHVGVLRRIEHLGMQRGRGGNKAWLYVGTGLWTLRTVRRLADRREEILISEPLRPGERLIISNNRPTVEAAAAKPPKGRRAKKAHRKAEAKAAKEQAKRDEKAAAADAKMQAKTARKQARRPKKVAPTETIVAD